MRKRRLWMPKAKSPSPLELIAVPKLSVTALDCDIVLYHGEDLIARAIRLFDNSHVNHSSIFLAPDRVGEALGNGIVKRPISVSLVDSAWVKVMRLKVRPRMAPVRKVAERYLAKGD